MRRMRIEEASLRMRECLQKKGGNDVKHWRKPQHWCALAFAQHPRHHLGKPIINIISSTFALLLSTERCSRRTSLGSSHKWLKKAKTSRLTVGRFPPPTSSFSLTSFSFTVFKVSTSFTWTCRMEISFTCLETSFTDIQIRGTEWPGLPPPPPNDWADNSSWEPANTFDSDADAFETF